MSEYKVRLLPADAVIGVRANEMILEAALRQGIDVTYSCRNGTCRSCIHQAIEGTVVQEDAEYCMISPQELADNRRLICLATVRSDAVLEKVKPSKRLQA